MIFPRSIFGLRGTIERPPQTPLARYLTALWPLWPDKIAPAYRYLLTGEGETILAELEELAKNPAWQGETYRQWQPHEWLPATVDPPLHQALQQQPIDDPAALRRLGQVVTAGVPTEIRADSPRYFNKYPLCQRISQSSKSVEWLDWLLPQLIMMDKYVPITFAAPRSTMLYDALKIDNFDLFRHLLSESSYSIDNSGKRHYACYLNFPDIDKMINREWSLFSTKMLTAKNEPTVNKKGVKTLAVEFFVASGCASSLRRKEYLDMLLYGKTVVRDTARKLLEDADGPDVDAFLETALATAAATDRAEAARYWCTIRGQAIRPALQKALDSERTESVRTVLRDLIGMTGGPSHTADTPCPPETSCYGPIIPPCPPVPEPGPIPEAAKTWLREWPQRFRDSVIGKEKKSLHHLSKEYVSALNVNRTSGMDLIDYFGFLPKDRSPEALDRLVDEKYADIPPSYWGDFGKDYRIDLNEYFSFLEGHVENLSWHPFGIRYSDDVIYFPYENRNRMEFFRNELLKFLVRDDVPLGSKLRMFLLMGGSLSFWKRNYNEEEYNYGAFLVTCFHKRWPLDLRQIAAVLRRADRDDQVLAYDFLRLEPWQLPLPNFLRLPPDKVWPYFAERPELLAGALVPPLDQEIKLDQVWRILEMMPAAPETLANAIVPFAACGDMGRRAVARRLLANRPQTITWALDFAGRAEVETRLAGLEWLAELRNPAAVPTLLQLLAKEKSDAGVRRLIEVLEICGHDTSSHFGLEAQTRSATKLLTKGVPKTLDWFPWPDLPRLRLRDGIGAVPGDLIKAWLIEAVASREPRGTALLKRKLQIADPTDLAAFGAWLLHLWLAEDTRALTPEEAQERAQRNLRDMKLHMEIGHYSKSHFESTMKERTEQYLKESKASAIPLQGLLGITALTSGAEMVGRIRPVLKAYDGTRRAQIMALLNMLSRLPYPTAIQLVLATATRHPVKSVQEEARSLVEIIAQEHGWTPDELANRTIPTAGLEDDGTLTLSFGSSRFLVRLTPQLALQLENPDGKVLKALPEPRKDDDPDQTKAAKARFGQARKELKQTVETQTARLYEAMCVGKSWRFEDWEHDLNRHPIMGRLVQRLIWQTVDDGSPGRVFRPLEDGSLSDAGDDPVTLGADQRLALSHAALLDDAGLERWRRHLADYEVQQPFQQLSRARLPAAYAADRLGETTAIRDFVGAMMNDSKIKSGLKRLGYRAVVTGDGGGIDYYAKPFHLLGLTAIIFISGHDTQMSQDKNYLVAVKEGAFFGLGGSVGRPEDGRPLAGVPRVLLAEVYADLHDVAAAGVMMADWERQASA